MATIEAQAPEAAPAGQEGLGGGGSAPDSVVIHPFLYPFTTLKRMDRKGQQLRKQLDKHINKGLSKQDAKEAQAYVESLDAARGALNSGRGWGRDRRCQSPPPPRPHPSAFPACCFTQPCPLPAALESPSVSDQAVTDAAATYLSLLLGLVSSSGSGDSGAPADVANAASPDEALSAAERGNSSASSPLTAPASKLRCAVRFEWSEAVVSPPPGAPPRTSNAADALFELASVLVATAVRLMHAAAAACADSATGVLTPASTRAYQLLRQAAGMLDFVAQSVAPALPAGLGGADTDLHVLRALSTLALADAQQLTVLRAVAKGNAPSLIASLAADSAALYSQACSQVRSLPQGSCPVVEGAASGASCTQQAALHVRVAYQLPMRCRARHLPLPPRTRAAAADIIGRGGGTERQALAVWTVQAGGQAVRSLGKQGCGRKGADRCIMGVWREAGFDEPLPSAPFTLPASLPPLSHSWQAYCLAYAHCFSGIALWKQQDQCGAGLKSLEAAAAQLVAAKKASAGFDAAAPASLNLHHRRVDEELDRVVYDSQRRMQRENDSAYLQPVPAQVPALPEGRRLVGSLPYALPQPAAAAREGVVERCFTAGPAPPAAPTDAPAAVEMHSGAAAAAGAGAGAAAAATGATAAAAGPDGKGEEQGCSVCRWVVMILCFPILLVLWVLGAIVWVLLLPLKCCVPCCGFPLQWAADVVLWLMRAPARGLLWATGKEEQKEEGGKEQQKK